jgi:hypothetical protein
MARATIAALLAAACSVALLAAGCSATAATAPIVTSNPPKPPTACTLVTLDEGRQALGDPSQLRADPSATQDSQSSCTFITSDPDTTLVVVAGVGGAAGLDQELTLDEGDLAAARTPISKPSGAFMISGTELGNARVEIGLASTTFWLTVSIRITGASRSALQSRIVSIATIAASRL